MDILHAFAVRSNEALLKVRQIAILNKLRGPGMYERFDDIAEAHQDTFNWLFGEGRAGDNSSSGSGKASTGSSDTFVFHERGHESSTSRAPSSKTLDQHLIESRDRFITWLRESTGFFHISGKPGAGKSTFMKYIRLHPDLTKHLEAWSAGSKLAVGSFFFWKPGNTMQKSIKGLLRGLLYTVLESSPDLIPVAFPQLWDLSLIQTDALPTLEHRDVMLAFRNVLAETGRSETFKVALFIDGLDEFDGRHLELLETMKDWMTKYPNGLKCCVSSRENTVFQEYFATCPRLRLHELTETDIRALIYGRLRSISDLADLQSSDMENIEDLISDRAEGVFLWVSLVLGTVEEGLLAGDEVQHLETKILLCPIELNAMFQHLLDSIQPGDRNWAFSAIAWVRYLQQHDVQVNDMKTTKHILEFVDTPNLTLLELSFLDSSAQSPDFKRLDGEDIGGWKSNTIKGVYRKLYGRCKGLLEVRNPEDGPTRDLGGDVVLTHRSVIEFLDAAHVVDLMARYIQSFDPFQATCQAFLGCLRYSDNNSIISLVDFFYRHGQNLDHEQRAGEGVDIGFIRLGLRRLLVLGIKAGRSQSEELMKTLDSVKTMMQANTSADCPDTFDPLLRLVLTTLSCGVYEYAEWVRRHSDLPVAHASQRRELYYHVQAFRHLVPISDTYPQHRYLHVLENFIRVGFDINSAWGYYIPPQKNRNWSIWKEILWDIVSGDNYFPTEWNYNEIIDFFLRAGADPRLIICNFHRRDSTQIDWLKPKTGWIGFEPYSMDEFELPLWTLDPRRSSADKTIQENILFVRESSPIFKAAARSGWILNLSDLMPILFPDHGHYFQELLRVLCEETPGLEAPRLSDAEVRVNHDVLGESWAHSYPRGTYTKTPLRAAIINIRGKELELPP